MTDLRDKYEALLIRLRPLFKAHWEENGDDILRPDENTGWILWSQGRLFFFECGGDGYAIGVLDENLFTSRPFFNVVAVYVRPEKRNGSTMLRLFRDIRNKARAYHCSFIQFNVPHDKANVDKFKRLSRGHYDLSFRVGV